jgi:hypothetical protein
MKEPGRKSRIYLPWTHTSIPEYFMPISNATLSLGGTCSVTGGTLKTFTEAGETIANGKKVVDLSQTDARLRPFIVCTNRPAKTDGRGKFVSKEKHTARLVCPKLRADGSISYPLVEVRFEPDVENTDTERNQMLSYAAQITGIDSDFTSFMLYGTTA